MFSSKKKKLLQALKANDAATVRALLQAYPQMVNRCVTRDHPGPLALALKHGNDAMVEEVLTAGADLDGQPCWSGPHVIADAIAYGRMPYVQAWLEGRDHLLAPRDKKWTLMHVAASYGQVTAAAMLVARGMDPVIREGEETPLDIARNKKYEAMVAFLQPYYEADSQRQRRAAEALVRPADAAAQWHKIDDQTVAQVREDAALGYRLTTVFNFALGRCTTIHRNLATDAESAVQCDIAGMAGMPGLQEAEERLQALGGRLPPAKTFSLRG